MNYFVLQVKTGDEDTFIKRALVCTPCSLRENIQFIFPQRKLPRRKDGKVITGIEPVFPGYIFLEAEELNDQLYWCFRTTPGFYRFLPESKNPLPLAGRDLATLKHFVRLGGIADSSKVVFDENSRIKVLQGPLKGMEGRIVKVDRRKGRAKVKLDMYEESFLIDFAFEIMEHE